jgi:hypothetical protein
LTGDRYGASAVARARDVRNGAGRCPVVDAGHSGAQDDELRAEEIERGAAVGEPDSEDTDDGVLHLPPSALDGRPGTRAPHDSDGTPWWPSSKAVARPTRLPPTIRTGTSSPGMARR